MAREAKTLRRQMRHAKKPADEGKEGAASGGAGHAADGKRRRRRANPAGGSRRGGAESREPREGPPRGGAIKSRPVKPSSPARSRRSELDLADIELAEMPRSVAVKPSSSPLGYTDSSDGGSDYSDLLISDGSESLRSELSSSSANISANISAVKPTSRVAHVDVQVRAPARIRHSAARGARAPRRDADRARRDADARSDALLTV